MNFTIFENKIKVKIYGPNLEIIDADMDFSIERTNEKDPNLCTLKIYNLTEVHMNQIMNNCKYVEIYTNQYGLKDDDGQLLWQKAFEGLLKETVKKPKQSYTKKGKLRKSKAKTKFLQPSITTGDDEADDYIQIELQEGNGSDIGTFISKSYRNGFNVKRVLEDLAKSINMEIIFDKDVKNFNITYPIILHENVRDALIKVASYIGCSANIQENKVYIKNINPKGVITYYYFNEDNIQQPKYLQDKKIEFSAPYMPVLIVDTFVKLTNIKQEIDGIFQIVKTESTFSNYKEECETKVTVKYD